MKRAFTIAAVAELVIVSVLLHTPIKDWLWTHPWTHSFLVAVPTIALAVIAFVELRHSEKANELREEANRLRGEAIDHQQEANELREQAITLSRDNTRLTKELDTERNKHLERIADHTKPPVTQAEKNAAKLRKHLRAKAHVSENGNNWGAMGAEIAEVNDDNVVTLFVASSMQSTTAFAAYVHCDDLQIVEVPMGSCPVQIKVLKRYGETVQLGEIKRWEDRNHPTPVQPTVEKGQIAYYVTYAKVGTAETRELHVYAVKDGSNYFVLEAKPDGTFYGNNVDISKRFMALQVEYEAAGFTRQQGGTGGSKHRLYIKTM